MYTTRELNQMKLRELLKLEDDLQEAIKVRKATEAREVKQKMAELAKREGFTLEDVFGKKLFSGRGYRSSMQAKYRNPEDSTQTWTGRGRKPNWMVQRLNKGASLDEFRV